MWQSTVYKFMLHRECLIVWWYSGVLKEIGTFEMNFISASSVLKF
jgi:hypothetical protein